MTTTTQSETQCNIRLVICSMFTGREAVALAGVCTRAVGRGRPGGPPRSADARPPSVVRAPATAAADPIARPGT